MNRGITPAGSHDNDLVIDEHGFAAMLQNDDLERDQPGIIGSPRVNPTGSGLWIEDSFPAAMNQITFALLGNFMRLEKSGDRFGTLGETDGHSAASDDVKGAARAPTRRRAARPLCNVA